MRTLRYGSGWSFLFPAGSRAKAAFTIPPSALYRSQPVALTSSELISPSCHSRSKNPAFAHSQKYCYVQFAL
ncbi:MAG: hypothetical protein LBQ88_15310, partial [Treponema sp.]|nr:hypothetical protein [Treponema sp.]